ncbi:hypothetical protein D3C72_2475960 [compost metagenome]
MEYELYADTQLSAAMYLAQVKITSKRERIAKCLICNSIFFPNRIDAITCSSRCRKFKERKEM